MNTWRVNLIHSACFFDHHAILPSLWNVSVGIQNHRNTQIGNEYEKRTKTISKHRNGIKEMQLWLRAHSTGFDSVITLSIGFYFAHFPPKCAVESMVKPFVYVRKVDIIIVGTFAPSKFDPKKRCLSDARSDEIRHHVKLRKKISFNFSSLIIRCWVVFLRVYFHLVVHFIHQCMVVSRLLKSLFREVAKQIKISI